MMNSSNQKEAPNKLPLVSFIVLAYNQEDLIHEAIAGAFSQTYNLLEIVLSDDGSTDGTFEVMQEMAEKYTGPHTIILNKNKRNLGLGAHVEVAAGLSSGAYLVLAGGDDISVPQRTELSVDLLLKHGELGGVFGQYHEFRRAFCDTGGWKPRYPVDGQIVKGNPSEWIRPSKKGRMIAGPGCAAMWNKKLFEDFPPIPDGTEVEDIILGHRALISGLGLGFSARGFVQYRVHQNNICANVDRATFAKRSLFAKAVSLRDAWHMKKKRPDLHSEKAWEAIIQTIETMLYRSAVLSRCSHVGRLRTRALLILGLKSAVSKKVKAL